MTILYVVALVPLLYGVGLGLALLVQADTRFNGVIRTLLFMPQTVLVVVALVWQVLVIDKIGLFNQLGATIGIGSFRGSAILVSRSAPSSRSASGS